MADLLPGPEGGLSRTPVFLAVTALLTLHFPQQPQNTRPHVPEPCGLESHSSSLPGLPQSAGFPLFSLATSWQSAHCGNGVISPADPTDVHLPCPRLLCLSDCLLHSSASHPLLCLRPQLVAHASVLQLFYSASSHTSPPLNLLISCGVPLFHRHSWMDFPGSLLPQKLCPVLSF